MDEVLQFVIKNDINELKLINKSIGKYLKDKSFSETLVYNIFLTIEEIMTNVVKYAYTDGYTHQLIIDLAITSQTLTITFTDEGVPFNAVDYPPPNLDIPLEDMKVGGLGIYIIKSIAKSMEYKRENNKNILQVVMDINCANGIIEN